MVAVVLVALVGTVWLGGEPDDSRPSSGGEWSELAPMPLAPRYAPVAVWAGDEVLVIGGGIGSPCPPNAGCTQPEAMARDGAAYDPDADAWRPIAEAPTGVGYWFRPVVVGDVLVLFGDERWWAYDVGDDAWRALPAPPRPVEDTGVLSARDGRVYAVARSGRVLVLDVAAESWSLLPPSPHLPALRPGSALATQDGVLVAGTPLEPEGDGDTPHFTVVERWDGSRWTRLPPTGQVGTFRHWTGERLVELDPQVATGLDGQPPFGGRLDPATAEWTPLPNAPDPEAPSPSGRHWTVVAAAGPHLAGWGYAYDDRTGRWTPLGQPRGTDVDSQQSGVWVDGDLIVVGGYDSETAYEDVAGLTDKAWVWTPA